MSRTLGNDFDEDDEPGAQLDLETGGQVGGGVTTGYEEGGVDYDDGGSGDGATSGILELDMPTRGERPSAQLHVAPEPDHGSGDLSPTAGPELGLAPVVSQARLRTNAQPPQPRASQSHMSAVSSQSHLAAAARSPAASSSVGSPAPPTAASAPSANAGAMIARFPDPPSTVWQSPVYALRVALRLLELRSNLESLRKRRSPDVALYEAALVAYDPKSFRLGLAISCACAALALFILCLPILIRLMLAD